MAKVYVLGNDLEELSRLKLQHDLWRDELLRLWSFSNIKNSSRVLDLGCGPGYTSLDILSYNTNNCALTSVDISESFLANLKHLALQQKLENHLKTQNSFIEELNLENKNFDTAFCRWLMIFVQNPEKAVQQVHHHLKKGGEFILQEYVSYDSMDLVPNYHSMRPVVEAIFKSWRAQGGEPNQGKYLPETLEKSGFKIKHLEPIAKFAQPTDALWAWPESFYKSFLPRLEKSGYLTIKQIQDFFSDWESAKTKPGSFFVAPTVINIIAEKV